MPTTAPQKTVAPPQVRKLKKGELLFSEGENSRAMYFLKSGMIRIFKKKGDTSIEIDTIRSGQVLGELAFLDGNPRSASGEALTDCELMEISGPTFQAVLVNMPDWLKMLLKTVVGRLRTASTRIRQLESASTAFDYSDKDGARAAHYVYLSPTDVLKVATGVLLVGARNGTPIGTGLDLRVGLLSRYVNQIMGIPTAKLTTMLDVFGQVGVISSSTTDKGEKVILEDIGFLEDLITYLNEENLVEPGKRHDLSVRGFTIMNLIAKHLPKFTKDEKGNTKVNLAEVKKAETSEDGKDPFRMEQAPELVKLGYIGPLNVKSNDEVYVDVRSEEFLRAHRLQRVVMGIATVNEQKRKGGGK